MPRTPLDTLIFTFRKNLLKYKSTLFGTKYNVLRRPPILSEIIFGKCRIPELLSARSWSQANLADKTGISEQRISDYITGNRKSMALKTAFLIAHVLDCRIEELYEYKVTNYE